MKLDHIDKGKEFDFGKTSKDYANYRDIYTQRFFQTIHALGIGREGQNVLDIGTGTGVLPRFMYQYGAKFTGLDISEQQINEAKAMAEKSNMQIDWHIGSANELTFNDNSFDAVTALQCFWYFGTEETIKGIHRILKPNGLLGVFTMAWLPFEDTVAGKTEELALKYNPNWEGAHWERVKMQMPIWLTDGVKDLFDVVSLHTYDEQIPFTHETWAGRIRACRDIGAALPKEEVEAFDQEHRALLKEITPEQFTVLHHVNMQIVRAKK